MKALRRVTLASFFLKGDGLDLERNASLSIPCDEIKTRSLKCVSDGCVVWPALPQTDWGAAGFIATSLRTAIMGPVGELHRLEYIRKIVVNNAL